MLTAQLTAKAVVSEMAEASTTLASTTKLPLNASAPKAPSMMLHSVALMDSMLSAATELSAISGAKSASADSTS